MWISRADQLVVITGLSGSGKSSLAFDTIYAEGQRRYVESLSAYARQFLDMMQKPDVDHISRPKSPRFPSNRKTTIEKPALDRGHGDRDLRLYAPAVRARRHALFPRHRQTDRGATGAGHGGPHHGPGGRAHALILLAPIIRDRKGEYRKEFIELRKQGFQRVKVDGAFYELDEPPTLDKKFRHDIDVVVDRIVVREGLETRLADSLRTALDLADGIAVLETAPERGRSRAP